MAFLQRTGSFDCSSGALHIPEMTGAKVSQTRFTNHVGTGSSWHCFAADFFKMAATSANVVGRYYGGHLELQLPMSYGNV